MRAVATNVLLLLTSVQRTHAFQPQSSFRRGVSGLRSTVESTEVNTGPITGTKTNIKYPTARGSQVDSRLIVDYKPKNHGETGPVASSSPLLALRLSHILFASHELATQTLEKLTKAEWNFEEMAKVVSNCVETREEGGGVGWVNLSEEISSHNDTDGSVPGTRRNPNQHLDLILPPSARKHILTTPTKPGDILLVESFRGVHLVQVVDVMVDVRKMSYIKAKRTEKPQGDTVIIKNKMELVKNAERKHIRGEGLKLASVLEGSVSRGDKLDLTYKIETMGCQMNLSDSERIEGQLMNLGIRPLGENEMIEVQIQTKNGDSKIKQKKKEPDVVVLNTCSIRDHAEQKVYSYLGPHTKRKRAGEDITIIVAGCVAQQEGQSLLRRIPEIDLVMGPQYANRIGDLLEDVANGNQVVATEASHIMEDSTKPRRQSSTCAWVNVIYGCNERCTYCIVPTTRGVEQSRPVESIVDEVKELVSQGFKEVTLLGQNIDAYGRDMIPKRKFSDLLRIVGDTPGLERLRFVTSHPRYMSLGCIDAVADTKSACEYFHIPFQSGSNNILKAMGRGHTREKFLQIVDRVRERLPDAGISADVIVGFPGETEQDFLDTLSIMECVKFDNVNTAAYSPRPNTPAAKWNNQISEDVKQDRLRRINELNLRHATERRARMIDRVVEVLVEER
jgi:tRNA-2-methylthio-N6-dimethylallyladenosine synthase